MEISGFISDLVLASAFRLIFFNGTTTTKEVKEEVRLRHPGLAITQEMVSNLMVSFEEVNHFVFEDNGTYRTYSLNIFHFTEDNSVTDDDDDDLTEVEVTKIEAISLVNELREDDYFEVSFIKKDDSLRDMNCIVKQPNVGLGYLLVYEVNYKDDFYDDTNIKRIDLRRLVSFTIDNVFYKVV